MLIPAETSHAVAGLNHDSNGCNQDGENCQNIWGVQSYLRWNDKTDPQIKH
jgi:hypothetical protein